MVSALKRNKSYTPYETLPCKLSQVLYTEFRFHDVINICWYVPKRNKAVTLMSIIQPDKTISEPKEKPEIIQFYSKAVSGVDV